MRLIDADELLTAFPYDDEPTVTKSSLRMTIKHMPTIDAEPTKHGHWVNNRNMYIEWATCSQCGAEWNKYENEFFRFNFCPNCGVKMDEGEEEE